MPIYEYQCKKCGKIHEITQRMADPPLTKCPDCKGKMEKLISLAGFQLKGGGWYKDGYASAKPESPSKSPEKATPKNGEPAPTPKVEKAESQKPVKTSSQKSPESKA